MGQEMAEQRFEQWVNREPLYVMRWMPSLPFVPRMFGHRDGKIQRNPTEKNDQSLFDSFIPESWFHRVVLFFVAKRGINLHRILRDARFFPHFT